MNNRRDLDPTNPGHDADWFGNNAAFTCPPPCGKVYVVSGHLNRNGRECPACGRSKGFVVGGAQSGGEAWIEWVGA